MESQIRERVTRGLKLSATGLATTLDATLNDMLSDAATTARLYLPQEAIESGDPKNFQWYADELVSKKNRYLAIVVSNSEGKVIGTNTVNQQGEPGFAKGLGQDISKEPWFKKVTENPCLRSIFRDLSQSKFSIGPKECKRKKQRHVS